jgi:hypothetical protein
MLTNKTTKEFYEKYEAMKKRLHIYMTTGTALFADTLKHFYIADISELLTMYEADKNLNNIPLRYFDSLYYTLHMYHPKEAPGSLSENTCLYKHCLIYDVLGAEPEFTDEEKTNEIQI